MTDLTTLQVFGQKYFTLRSSDPTLASVLIVHGFCTDHTPSMGKASRRYDMRMLRFCTR